MLYEVMHITGRTRLAGLIGWPAEQSRSPALHKYWLDQHGIDGKYPPLPVRPGALAAALAGLRDAGLDVTVANRSAATTDAVVLNAPMARAARAGFGLLVADIVTAPRVPPLLNDAAWFGVTSTVDVAAYRAVGVCA